MLCGTVVQNSAHTCYRRPLQLIDLWHSQAKLQVLASIGVYVWQDSDAALAQYGVPFGRGGAIGSLNDIFGVYRLCSVGVDHIAYGCWH